MGILINGLVYGLVIGGAAAVIRSEAARGIKQIKKSRRSA